MLSKDFKEFAELLGSNGVEYLVVGGYALAAHGRPRYTGDLDFWVGTDAANGQRLLQALDDFKANKRATGRLQDRADLQSLGEDVPD